MIVHLSEQPNVEFVPSLPERDKVVWNTFNATAQRHTPSTLHGAFMEQVTKSPHEAAVIYNDQQLTYRQLDERSISLHIIWKQQGVTRGDRVGLLAERGIETIVNVVGILKAGAAYVPVDPDYPEERQHYILQNSNCNILLRPDVYVTEKLSSFSIERVRHEVQPHELAYIIYTSGSTGIPKGVATAHGPAMNTIQDINTKFEVSSQDRILGISSMCFDLSVYDILEHWQRERHLSLLLISVISTTCMT